MENKNQNDLKATESIGVTELHKKHPSKVGRGFYCYCDELPNRPIAVGYNHTKEHYQCSVCGKEVKE